MDLYVSCKGCKKECPSAVDMTLIKTEYLAQRNAPARPIAAGAAVAGLPRWLHRARRSLLKRLVRLRNASPWVAGVADAGWASRPGGRSRDRRRRLCRADA